MADFYLYLSSNDCINLFPSNTQNQFSVNLGKQLTGEWKCGLKEIYFMLSSEIPTVAYILCDKCERSYVRGTYMTLLRRITLPVMEGIYSESFSDTYYKRVTSSDISQLTISIRGELGMYKGLEHLPTLCVLHFIKND